jgi:hypothetical protein
MTGAFFPFISTSKISCSKSEWWARLEASRGRHADVTMTRGDEPSDGQTIPGPYLTPVTADWTHDLKKIKMDTWQVLVVSPGGVA